MTTPNWNLPLPSYDRDVNQTVRIYKNAILEVIAILESLATYGTGKEITQADMTSVLTQIAILLGDVDKETEIWIREVITEAFIEGQAETLVAIGDSPNMKEARLAILSAPMSALAVQTIDAMVSDTFEDLLNANNKMKRETIKMVRAVVAEQMKLKSVQGMGRNTTRNAIVQALTKKGIVERFREEGDVAIIARNGRRWRLTEYAEMVTRTKMLQSHSEGIRIEALERGIDLAIVSSHGAKDACKHFEGQIVSMNGLTEGFLSYEELRKSNLIFHPNCKHRITPVRDISLLPESVRKKFEEGSKNAKARLKAQKKK